MVDLFRGNPSGSEGIGYGGETKKKKFTQGVTSQRSNTKLTLLCNKDIKNVAVYPNKSLTSIIQRSKSNKKIKHELNINHINNKINHIQNLHHNNVEIDEKLIIKLIL